MGSDLLLLQEQESGALDRRLRGNGSGRGGSRGCRLLNRPTYFFCAHDFTAAISASASLVVPLLVHSCNIHAVSFFTRNLYVSSPL